VQEWIKDRGIDARFIAPGSPWQNGHNESFNGVFRDGCLNRWLFESIREAREASEAWLHEYNEERPHGSLGGRLPAVFFELTLPAKVDSMEEASLSLGVHDEQGEANT
jgi:putative transposase